MRLAAVLLLGLIVSATASAEGRFERHVVGGRQVTVYLPTAFRAGLPVVVASDAQNLFGGGPYGSWNLHHAVERVRPAVILASDHLGLGRVADYDGSHAGGGATSYNAWVRDHLLPWGRARYGLSSRLEDVVGLGSSMGAHPLLDDMIDDGKPHTYGKWAALSPALSVLGGRLQQRFERAPSIRRGRLFLLSGDAGKKNDDVVPTERLRDHLLDERGWTHGQDLVHWRARGRQHDESTWRDFAEMALAATLGR
jgi:hypothetical protein